MGFVQTHLPTHCNARGDGLLTPSGVVPQALLVPRALRGLLDNRGDRAWGIEKAVPPGMCGLAGPGDPVHVLHHHPSAGPDHAGHLGDDTPWIDGTITTWSGYPCTPVAA